MGSSNLSVSGIGWPEVSSRKGDLENTIYISVQKALHNFLIETLNIHSANGWCRSSHKTRSKVLAKTWKWLHRWKSISWHRKEINCGVKPGIVSGIRGISGTDNLQEEAGSQQLVCW